MTFTLNAGLHHCAMDYFTVSLSASQHCATHCCYHAKSKEALSFVADKLCNCRAEECANANACRGDLPTESTALFRNVTSRPMATSPTVDMGWSKTVNSL